jgi:aminoglycoside 6'-N-acetyltransferase
VRLMIVVGTETMLESISFRPLSRSDFPLFQRWLLEPHVATWWHESLDLAGIEAKYGPRIDGTEPTYVFVIEYRKRLVGWIQWYRWSDYPEHALQLGAGPESAGIDLAIGEREMMGMGLGPAAIRKFINQTIFVDPTIRAVIADPAESNLRSLRAFKKAGFSVTKTVELLGESFQRSVVHLGRPR